jgi:hypothetical protein
MWRERHTSNIGSWEVFLRVYTFIVAMNKHHIDYTSKRINCPFLPP